MAVSTVVILLVRDGVNFGGKTVLHPLISFPVGDTKMKITLAIRNCNNMSEKIDITKKYITRSGKRVVGLSCVPRNSCGELVTYPIKGSIVIKEKPLKLEYCIWSDEGVTDVVFGKNKGKDLFPLTSSH